MNSATPARPVLSALPPAMTSKSLTNRSVSAFGWGSAGSFVKLIVQIGTQIFLARLLGPEQYGLFAIGAIVISFSNFFADVGIAYGLIQRPVVLDEHIRFIFTWQLVLGFTVSMAVASLAGPIATLFKEPRAQSILLALAPICFVQAISAVSLNLLKRGLDFKALQIAQTTGYVVGYVLIGVPLAILGWQAWALVGAWATQSVVTLALLYFRVRHASKPLFRHPDEIDMASFGLKVLATNLTNWMIGNIERVVIARHLPTASVGLYATPYNLMYTPANTAMGVVQPVMYAACARIQGEQARIAKAYLTLVAAITLSAFPVFAAISVVAPTFMLALYGPAWTEAAAVLRPIALAMPFYLLWNITTPVLWTNGQPSLEFKIQLPLAAIWLTAALAAVQHSLAAVAWTVCALYVLRLLVFVWAVARTIRIGIRAYFKAMRGGMLLGTVVAGTAWLVDSQSLALGAAQALTRLTLDATACLLVCLCAVKLAPSIVGDDLSLLVRRASDKIPVPIAKLLQWLSPDPRNK